MGRGFNQNFIVKENGFIRESKFFVYIEVLMFSLKYRKYIKITIKTHYCT